MFTQAKEWLVPIMALSLTLAAGVWAVKERAAGVQTIAELRELGGGLSQLSEKACQGALSPAARETLRDQERDFLTRLEDCAKPAVVAATLSETIRRVGASVRKIEPVQLPGQAGARESGKNPLYRVALDGTYRQLAEFMDLCPQQRLPVRVTDLMVSAGPTINPSADGEGSGNGASGGEGEAAGVQVMLRANIILETLQAENAGKKGTQ